jgi:hypothetical protein
MCQLSRAYRHADLRVPAWRTPEAVKVCAVGRLLADQSALRIASPISSVGSMRFLARPDR